MSAAARLDDAQYAEVDRRLSAVDAAMRAGYPGDPAARQPVHTVYLPADRYTTDLVPRWGATARAALAEHAPGPAGLAALLDLAPLSDAGPRDGPGLPRATRPRDDPEPLYDAVLAKLHREPIEDLRIDFEDGYGTRPDDVEDGDVRAAAAALARAVHDGVAPPFVGIRFKSLQAATRYRGLRTVDLFLAHLLDAAALPPGFVLTLPKVTSAEQVEVMAWACEQLERGYGLAGGRLQLEVQVETPQAILGADGTATVARMAHAAPGRVCGLHYGTYDYSAALGIAAAHQSMAHPAADHAKAVMQLAAAGTGVRVCDGSTHVLPVGDPDAVRTAWRLHARLVRRSLMRGFYQGWDLHPAQLPTRYGATYAFFRAGLAGAAPRLRAYLACGDGGVLDEPATAQALAGVVTRGLDCGAVHEGEVHRLTGLRRAELDALTGRRAG